MKNAASPSGLTVFDVIIAGAGPVGLFLAAELALRKCSVLLLEREQDPQSPWKQLPFGIRGLSAPTIEALDRRGLLGELVLHKHLKNPHKTGAPSQGPGRQAGHFAGIPFLEGNIDRSQWSYRVPGSAEPSLMTDMAEIESVLARRVAALGVERRQGLGVTALGQTTDGVTVTAGGHSFHGQWLVGCDGSRSVVRKTAGFDFAGTEPAFTGYSAQVDLADAEQLSPGRNLTAVGMYFQSQPGYLVMLEFDGGAAHRAEPVSRETLQQVLRRVSDTNVTISALHAATTWTDRARQATTYRQGRVLLAGDSAHIHAPLGGQGLNLGLGDAMNLGWKLAATIHGDAPQDLLDTYSAERIPLGAQVLDWSRAQVAIMKPDPEARALNAIVRDLLGTRDGATYFAGRVWGVDTHYDFGEGHPLLGRSVPNFECAHGATVGECLRDGRGLLVDFAGDAELHTLAEEFPARIQYVAGQPAQPLGARALLVRPDGYIAHVADTDKDSGALRNAVTRWFGGEAHKPAAV